MPYADLESAVMGWLHVSDKSARCEARKIAILLFDGFSLLGAGIVAEVFHVANELSSSANEDPAYDVRFLSADGGHVTCSSSVRVWTDGLDARHYGGFDALFVAGGKGADVAANDGRIIGWLRQVQSNTATVKSIAEGRKVLDGRPSNAARPQGRATDPSMSHVAARRAWRANLGDRYESDEAGAGHDQTRPGA